MDGVPTGELCSYPNLICAPCGLQERLVRMARIDIHIALQIVVNHVHDRTSGKQLSGQPVGNYHPEIAVLKMLDPVIHYQVVVSGWLPS
ncbi:hypothetical protein D3C78_1314750 [compost metagenome]